MNEEQLIEYYNKFNEDKRLNTRRGQVEFIVSMKYICEYLKQINSPKIIDIGAGSGKYSIALEKLGYDVTAVELVKHNLRMIEKKSKKIKSYLGNAIDLSRFENETFDFVLLFGPMYHLISKEEKIKALEEAKRIVKKNGIIMVAYCMNEYAVITHGFIDNNIIKSINDNKLTKDYKIISKSTDLYSYVRLEEIYELNKIVGLERVKIISPDGAASYIRKSLNKMNEEEFKEFINYQFSTCERLDLLGAAPHTVDILKKR